MMAGCRRQQMGTGANCQVFLLVLCYPVYWPSSTTDFLCWYVCTFSPLQSNYSMQLMWIFLLHVTGNCCKPAECALMHLQVLAKCITSN
ncbi:hypothetical protein M758_2G149400 [Ceratodon purpureus]|nr:hypothetical protein M758_2G149400 [Ceratodon purpureus]